MKTLVTDFAFSGTIRCPVMILSNDTPETLQPFYLMVDGRILGISCGHPCDEMAEKVGEF